MTKYEAIKKLALVALWGIVMGAITEFYVEDRLLESILYAAVMTCAFACAFHIGRQVNKSDSDD